ncbi:hypothetical protein ABPG75_012442 [Micractinium tetrahymenae]
MRCQQGKPGQLLQLLHESASLLRRRCLALALHLLALLPVCGPVRQLAGARAVVSSLAAAAVRQPASPWRRDCSASSADPGRGCTRRVRCRRAWQCSACLLRRLERLLSLLHLLRLLLQPPNLLPIPPDLLPIPPDLLPAQPRLHLRWPLLHPLSQLAVELLETLQLQLLLLVEQRCRFRQARQQFCLHRFQPLARVLDCPLRLLRKRANELVRQLLARGNTVVATTRRPAAASELQALRDGAGSRLHVTQLDVAAPESVESWAAGVRALATRVDLLVNNAGVTDGWKELGEVSAQDMLDCFVPNCIGPLLVTQQLHKQGVLGSRSGGSSLVANMSSKMGSIDDNGSGSEYAYRASKAALNIVNKSLSIDLAAEDICCVLLHPGYVRTDMTGWEGNIAQQPALRACLRRWRATGSSTAGGLTLRARRCPGRRHLAVGESGKGRQAQTGSWQHHMSAACRLLCPPDVSPGCPSCCLCDAQPWGE